ncbi:hypothetical protein ACRALDRAFT_2021800 [Sodiomyces alcalophilus JCM 7366]|uniref:uncharacterized protein n=1 Tax=Sodiomyces alcalophilus JCM 7366 TaxID=591952 RepID=UPI0039B4F4A2
MLAALQDIRPSGLGTVRKTKLRWPTVSSFILATHFATAPDPGCRLIVSTFPTHLPLSVTEPVGWPCLGSPPVFLVPMIFFLFLTSHSSSLNLIPLVFSPASQHHRHSFHQSFAFAFAMASVRFPSSLLTLASVWFLFATCASAFLEIPFTRRTDIGHASPERRRQVQTGTRFEQDIAFGYGFQFVANVSVGTPPQELSMLVSFDSHETWVMDIATCGDGPYSSVRSCHLGSFDPNESDSFQRISRDSLDAYLPDGSWVEGDHILETLQIGSAKVANTTLGLAHEASSYLSVNVLGLGYNTVGPSFLDLLETEGLINSTAFSAWPTTANASEGSLLLGAIDTNKFSGDIQRFQAYKYAMQYTGFYAKIGSVNGSSSDDGALEPIVDASLNSDLPFAGINPTTMITNLPLSIAQPIWDRAGVLLDGYSSGGEAVIPCARASSLTGRVSLELGGAGGYILTANLRDLVIPQDIYSYEYFAYYDDDDWELDGETMCAFSVQNIDTDYYNEENGHWTIGSYFLRDTYLVFDLANEEVGMAPVVRSSGSDATRANIVPFASSSATIPESTKVGQSWCWAYQDCDDGNSDGTRYSNDDGYYRYSDRSRDNTGLAVAVGIGAAVGSILLVGLLIGIWAFRRYRKIRKEELETGIIKHPDGIILVDKNGKPLTLSEPKEPDAPDSPPLPPRPAATASTTRASRNDSRRAATVLPPISEDTTGLAMPTPQAGQTEMAGALHPTNDPATSAGNTDDRRISPVSSVQPIGDVPPHAIISDSPATEAQPSVSPESSADPQSSTAQQRGTENPDETGVPRIPKPSTQE